MIPGWVFIVSLFIVWAILKLGVKYDKKKSLSSMTYEDLNKELYKVDELLFYGPHEWVNRNTVKLRRRKLELEHEINKRNEDI